VFVEGILVIDNLDIYHQAPGNNIPYIVTLVPFITDGSVTIDFVTGSASDPQINGIEIYDGGIPLPSPTNSPLSNNPTAAPIPLPPNSAPVTSNGTFTDIVINCGGTSIFLAVMCDSNSTDAVCTDNFTLQFIRFLFTFNLSNTQHYIGPLYLEQSGARYWSADNFYTGGSTYSLTSIAIANTVDDPIYQSERLGAFSYSIPVPVGTYEITIHLAEMYVRTRKCHSYQFLM
jgi:hypothetical protein